MEYQICRATEKDLTLMQRLFYQTVTISGSHLFTKAELKFYAKLAIDKRHWISKFTNDFVYNAKLNGEIIGSFSLTQDGKIEYIFVHKNYQRQGIATGLYRMLEEIASKNRIKVLTTSVNSATKAFYEKHGFEIIESVKKVAGGESVSELSAVKYI